MTAAENLATVLTEHPFGDDEGLLFTIDHEVSVREARARVAEIAVSLQAAGVRAGQAVGVRLPNGPDCVLTMIAVWTIDAVFIPLNPRAPQAELDHVLAETDPAAIVDEQGVTARESSRVYAPGVAFATFTSGTTGRPKAILHDHDAYFELIDRVIGSLRGADADAAGTGRVKRPAPNLIPVSLALNAGIYNALFGLRAGAALVIMDRFSPREFADLVRRFQIRATVLPPAALTMLADDPEITDLSPLRYVRSITAPLSPLAARRFTERFGAFVLNSYGQAETGEVIGWTAADAKAHPEKLGAAGRPLPNVGVRIDADGELWVKPPRRAVAYAHGEGLDDRVDEEGYLRTGDLARIDDDGFVWIEGRVSDVINRGGNKVFPDQVEEVLRLAPGVREVAVAGAPDERLGEVPVAFVAGAFDPAQLDALCREHLAPYKVPVDYVAVEALPRSEIGKVLRRKLVVEWPAR